MDRPHGRLSGGIALGVGTFSLLALFGPELIAAVTAWSPIGGRIAIATIVLLSAFASMGLSRRDSFSTISAWRRRGSAFQCEPS